jgi:hypothetical protein
MIDGKWDCCKFSWWLYPCPLCLSLGVQRVDEEEKRKGGREDPCSVYSLLFMLLLLMLVACSRRESRDLGLRLPHLPNWLPLVSIRINSI